MNSDEWQRIASLHAGGETIKGISRRLGMSRNTVRRALQFEAPPDDARGTTSTLYDTHEAEIKRWLTRDPGTSVSGLATSIGGDRAPSTLARHVARAERELGHDVDEPAGLLRVKNAPTDVPSDPDSSHASLPRYATSFIGRHHELARLRGLLGEHRLVSLTGPGGIGKTRLAAHLATDIRRAFPDGVRFVGLASLRSPELLSQAVLEGLGLAGRDQQGETAEAALLAHLSDRQLLLVIDNGEHLIEACAGLVHLLLRGTSRLRILLTSREVLSLPEEFVFPLSPLPLSPTSHDPRAPAARGLDTALELFESRADSVLSGFRIDDTNREAVRRICVHLDGLPLAIELACARLPVLSVHELAERLDHRLDLLNTGNRAAPVRHRSLAATLDWSHDLCTPEQRLLWKRASIFPDGFDLAMAEEACGDDQLTASRVLDATMALVAKSILLREERAGAVRFRMLETIREYGQGHLRADESQELHLALLAWISSKVTELVSAWAGPDQVRFNRWIRSNRANLRTALQWATEEDREPAVRDTAARIVAEPWFLWAGGFSVREHRLWLHRLSTTVSGRHRGQVLATLALVQTLQGDRAGATTSLDDAGRLASATNDASTLDFVEHTRGLAACFAGDSTAAEALMLDALERYREREPRGGLRSALHVHLGMLYAFTGQHELARQHYSEVRQRGSATGERWFRAYAEFGLGAIALGDGDPEVAQQMALDGLRMIRDFDDEIAATLILDLLGWAEAARGHADTAAVLAGSASTSWGAVGQQLYGSSYWVDVRERYTATAREALGTARYAQLHDDGASMSLSDVIAFALDETAAMPAVPDRPLAPSQLTRRQGQVAELVAEGLSNKDIAARLVLSPRTVEGHVERVLQTLCLTSRTQLVQRMHATTGAEPARRPRSQAR